MPDAAALLYRRLCAHPRYDGGMLAREMALRVELAAAIQADS